MVRIGWAQFTYTPTTNNTKKRDQLPSWNYLIVLGFFLTNERQAYIFEPKTMTKKTRSNLGGTR
jgi:hypothetical protein